MRTATAKQPAWDPIAMLAAVDAIRPATTTPWSGGRGASLDLPAKSPRVKKPRRTGEGYRPRRVSSSSATANATIGEPVRYATLAEVRVRFEERWTEFEGRAQAYFVGLKPEAKDEAVANSLYLTWRNIVALVAKGKADDGMFTCTFYFACRWTRRGRAMEAVKEIDARESRDSRRSSPRVGAVNHYLDAYVGKRDRVLDIVACKLDIAAWLDWLTDDQRQLATLLAAGNSMKDVSQLLGIPMWRMDFLRCRLARSFTLFMIGGGKPHHTTCQLPAPIQ